MAQKHTMPVYPGSAGEPGLRSTGSYLIAGRPYMVKALLNTGKVYQVVFPFVTRAITVINQDVDSDDLQVSFANHANAWTHHSITLANNRDSITMNVRASSLFLRVPGAADVNIEIFAEMTDISGARHEAWASSDQSRKGVDTVFGMTGDYPDDTAANDIIDQT